MNADEIKLTTPDEAMSTIESAFANGDHELLERLQREVWYKLRDPEFPVKGNLRLFVDFYESWHWFRHVGVQPEDMMDVYERALPLVELVLKHPVPANVESTSGRDRSKAFQAELSKIPGYEEFIAYARARLEWLLATPKYKPTDPDHQKW